MTEMTFRKALCLRTQGLKLLKDRQDLEAVLLCYVGCCYEVRPIISTSNEQAAGKEDIAAPQERERGEK